MEIYVENTFKLKRLFIFKTNCIERVCVSSNFEREKNMRKNIGEDTKRVLFKKITRLRHIES